MKFSFVAALAVGLSVSLAQADPKIDGKTAAKPSPAESAALVNHFKRAFEEGFAIGPTRLQEAEKHLAQARRLAPRDPRVDYAHGLVLVRQSHVEQAIAPFKAAIENDKSYWPAWQAAIWAQLAANRYESGLKQLDEYAQAVEEAETRNEVSEAQRDAARWIGQLIESLARSADSKKLHDLLAAHQVHLLDTFGTELSEAVEAGSESIRDREFELDQAADNARRTAEKSAEVRKERKAAQLDKSLEGAAKKKEDNEKSKEDWKSWLDDELAKSDKDLGRLERDYTYLNQRVQSLSQSIILAGQDMTYLNAQLSMFNPQLYAQSTQNTNAQNAQAMQNSLNANPQNLQAIQNMQSQLLQRQNQMVSYQTDYNASVGRMSQIAQAGALATSQKAAAIVRYEKATGDLTRKNAGLDKWSGRLKNQKQKLVVTKPAAKGGRNADNKTAPASFRTILPLDVAHEKEHLLASFAPPAAPADGKGAGR